MEPIGRNNFLELTYNIRGTNSEMDKRTFRKDNSGTNDYTVIDTAYTRLVKNDFLNQNISLNFRSMRKNFNYMIGVGIEPSSTKTEITDPKMEEKIIPRKNYLNFAPRARFHYNWDKRHNLRVDYRGSAESPTAQQLYDGIISQNGFNVTTGNPNLRPSFENRVDIRYQKFNPEKASSMILFGRFTHTSNDIVTVSKYDGPSRITSYDNINGNWNGNLRFIFNFPLKNKKFSINSMSFGSYEKSNTLINNRNSVDPQKNRANIYRLRENMGLRFTSDLLEFNVRGNISYYSVNNSISTNSNKNTYDYGGYFDFTLNLPYDFRIDSDITYSTNSGYGEGFNRNEWLWNASISKDIFKAKNGTIRFKIYDILQERSNISRSISSESIQDSRTNTISSYFMFNFVYRFQIFKGGAKASDMRGPEGPPHRRGMRM
ncbi:MAG: outer membrane beta-barrel protein [Dysgonomonas sp.]